MPITMSIKIIKQGLSDRIVDMGRYGYQDLGIQPSGPMDYLSAQLANLIIDNAPGHPVIELHFPAGVLEFDATMYICISGANFVPIINEKSVVNNRPIKVGPKDQLRFLQPINGRTAYLAFKGTVANENKWLNSYSSFQTTLQKDTIIDITPAPIDTITFNANKADLVQRVQSCLFNEHTIQFIPGPAWNDLDANSIQQLLEKPFSIDPKSNRMGFLLNGPKLHLSRPKQYLSAAVTKGTLQLLPNGHIIILMADHQTIGGYANLGQIILVDLPRFAQFNHQCQFKLSLTNVQTAHQLYRSTQSWFNH